MNTSRSKAEAKREAKELKFKGTDTICKEAVPSMEKASERHDL